MSEVVVSNGNTVLMGFIERAAHDPSFDVQKFEVLLRLQMEVADKQARRAFNEAMAAAQAEMLPVIRDATNSGVRSKYAKLETIDAAMRPIYTRHGFSIRFGSAPAPRESDMRITCTVAHSGGYFEENHLDSPVSMTGSQGGRMAMTPVQAVGSVTTYLRRYLLCMTFNIVLADEDDDGEAPRMQVAQTAMSSYPQQEGQSRSNLRAAAATAQPAPVKRQTIADWLAAHRIALKDCESAEAVNAILESEEVQRARETFRNGAKQQLEDMISEALAKWYHEPPEDEGEEEPLPDLAALALP